MQSTFRCIAGAVLMSAVMGAMSYTAAQNRFENERQELKDLAFRACLDLGFPDIDERGAEAVQVQLDLCNFAHKEMTNVKQQR